MSEFLFQVIPYLRLSGAPRAGEFLSALEEVLELGSRYVVRLGGATVLASMDDFMVGPRGLGIAGTGLVIPFDGTLKVVASLPDHFHMPSQPSTRYRRTAFGYVSGADQTFGMIARDDDIEPGRHFREALTDAIGNMKKIASMAGRSPMVTVMPLRGQTAANEGLTIDVDGFRSPMSDIAVRWEDVTMFEIADRVRLTSRSTVYEISA